MRIFLAAAFVTFGFSFFCTETRGQTEPDYGGGNFGDFESDFGQNGLYDNGDIPTDASGNQGTTTNPRPIPHRIRDDVDPEEEKEQKAERERKRAERESFLQDYISKELKSLVLSLKSRELALVENRGLTSLTRVLKPGVIKTTSPGKIIRVRGIAQARTHTNGGVIAVIGNTNPWVWIEGINTNQSSFKIDALVLRGEHVAKPMMVGLKFGNLQFVNLYNVLDRISPVKEKLLLQMVREEIAKRKAWKAQQTLKKVRIWKDVSGNLIARARFVKLEDGEAILKDKEGKVIAVPLEKLSDKDRNLIESL
ncbi:MAG: SHD1 domain-containing protein [Pirellulales bacterium]|nr:SHD1 domain-containing protein [Pirellulales bacterium]